MTNERLMERHFERCRIAGFTDADGQQCMLLLANLMVSVVGDAIRESFPGIMKEKKRPLAIGQMMELLASFALDAAEATMERGEEGVTMPVAIPVKRIGPALALLHGVVNRLGYAEAVTVDAIDGSDLSFEAIGVAMKGLHPMKTFELVERLMRGLVDRGEGDVNGRIILAGPKDSEKSDYFVMASTSQADIETMKKHMGVE